MAMAAMSGARSPLRAAASYGTARAQPLGFGAAAQPAGCRGAVAGWLPACAAAPGGTCLSPVHAAGRAVRLRTAHSYPRCTAPMVIQAQ